MKKIVPTICTSVLMFIFVFGLTVNFVKAQTAMESRSAVKTFTVSEIINKLVSGKIISTDEATKARVRALFEGPTTPPTVKVAIPAPGVLSLTYERGSFAKKESTLSGKQSVHITAGSQDVLIYNLFPAFKSNKSTVRTRGTTSSFVGNENTTKELYKDLNGNQYTVWRIKAGKTAKFAVNISAPAKELLAGNYTMILSGVTQVYGSDGAQETIPSAPGTSNSIAVVGEGITSGTTTVVKTVDKGSLRLSYDSNKKESSLAGLQQVAITAGSQDALVNWVNLRLKYQGTSVAPKGFEPNGTVRSFYAVSGASKEKFDTSAGYVDVWRIKAGQTAVFDLSIVAPPKNMFPGGYTVSVTNGVQVVNGSLVNFTEDNIKAINSDVVTIIGENAASSTISINSNIKPGQEGQQVTLLQQALKKIGLYSGEITGFFGNLTKQSVTQFQTANALDAVGEVGPKTRTLLNAMLNQ